MKKWTTVIFAFILMFSLSACGGNGGEAPSEAAETHVPTLQTVVTEPSVPETTEPPRFEIEKSREGEPEIPDLLLVPDYREGFPRIEGKVLYDENGIRVTMQDCTLEPEFYNERGDRVARPSGELPPDYMVYYEIPLVLENESDVNIRMSSFDFAINRKAIVTTSGGAFGDAAPHSRTQTQCSFFQSDINRNARGMALPRDFQLVLTFFDLDHNERIASSDVISFSSDVDAGYTENVEPYPVELWQEDGIAVRAGKLYQNRQGNVKLEFSVENTFGAPLTVTGADIAVNGTPVELRFARWVIPGTTDSQPLEITAKELKSWGLSYEDITQLTMTLICTRHYEEQVLLESDPIEMDFVE